MRIATRVMTLLLLVVAGSRVQAQRADPSALQARLQAALAADSDRIRRLEAQMAALEARARNRATDTVRVEGVMAAVSPALAPLMRAALPPALAHARRRWGAHTVAAAFDGWVVRADVDSGGRDEALLRVVRGDRARLEQWVDPRREPEAALDRFIGAYLAQYVEWQLWSATKDSVLARWLGNADAGRPAPALDRAVVDLLTSPASVNRQCAEGQLARCAEALGLVPTADPKANWYSADDRRVIARAWWNGRHKAEVAKGVRNPCEPARVSPACQAWIDSLRPETWRRPMAQEGLRAFLDVALESREGTWDRLRDSTERGQPLGARLAAAAGVPLDTLLAAWRRRLLAVRPEPVRPAAGALLVTVLFLTSGFAAAAFLRGRA